MIRILFAFLVGTTSLSAQQFLPDTLRGHPGDTLMVRVVVPAVIGTYQLRLVRSTGAIVSRALVLDTALSVVATTPSPVTLSVIGSSATSVTLAWTAPDDGTGAAANIALRWTTGPLIWGAIATELAVPGTTVGAMQSVQVTGLVSGVAYQVQAIPYRGTLNVNAVFGPLSNVVTGTTGTIVILPPPPPPSPPPPTTGLWANEPAGWTTMTDFAFDNYTSGGWHTNPGPTIAIDPTAPASPPNVAQWFYPAGFGAGSSPGTVYFPATMKDHYVGYYFKYSNPYSNQAVGTKQWYPASSVGSNYFMLFASDSKLWMYVQADGAHGSSYNLSSNVSNPTITLGVWHKLEILQRYPSSSSATDGVFRWWIDGVLCGNYPNVTWNVNSIYDEVRFVPVWGGVGGAVGFNSFWWVDHVHLSRP